MQCEIDVSIKLLTSDRIMVRVNNVMNIGTFITKGEKQSNINQ